MTFRQYIQLLAESIGLHQIPVLSHATEIRYFLAEDAVHHQFVTTLVRDIYKESSCGHLDAIVNPGKTLTHLAVRRSALLSEDDTDICRVRLMNQLCEVSAALLDKNQPLPGSSPAIENLPELAKI